MSWALVLLLVAGQAEPPPLEEDLAFVEGRRLYDELEPARAVFKFKEALRAPGRSGADRARIHTWLGLTYALLGESESARASFTDALALDPAVVLPGEPAPKVVAMFEDIRGGVHGNATTPPAAADLDPGASAGDEEPGPSAPDAPPAAGTVADGADGSAPATATEAGDNGASPDAPASSATPDAGLSAEVWLIGAGASAAATVVLAVAGGVLGLQTLTVQQAANQPGVTQVEAKARSDEANGLALFANGLYLGAGVTAVAAAAFAGAYLLLGPVNAEEGGAAP